MRWVAVWPTETWMPERVAVVKPSFEKVSVYSPMGRALRRNWPVLPVSAERELPEAAFLART